MSAEFEKQKNIRASAITGGVAGSLLILFIMVKWAIPVKSEPPVEQFIEIISTSAAATRVLALTSLNCPGSPLLHSRLITHLRSLYIQQRKAFVTWRRMNPARMPL